MKWYIWVLIGLAILGIIYAVTKSKSSTTIASVNPNSIPGFNPYEIIPIS